MNTVHVYMKFQILMLQGSTYIEFFTEAERGKLKYILEFVGKRSYDIVFPANYITHGGEI